MFDIAFSELLLIAVVTLLVVGPERLPRVARTLGLLAGRLQRYVAAVKADVERELRTHELQSLNAELRQTIHRVETGVQQEVGGLERELAPPQDAVQERRDPPATTP